LGAQEGSWGGFAQGKYKNKVFKKIGGPAAAGRLRRVTVGPILGGPPLDRLLVPAQKEKTGGYCL